MKTLYIILSILLFQISALAQENVTISKAQIDFIFKSNNTTGTIAGFSSSSVIDRDVIGP